MDDTDPAPPTVSSPVIWGEDGVPRSRLFGDIYFSSADGLAESRAVFLAGCDLPRAWDGRDRFTVGELGFGSGLNILALLDLWRRARPNGGRLQNLSVEAFPMPAEDARRALAAWPEVADLAEALLAHWPRRARGFHRIDFPELGATLDLAVLDVLDALQAWAGRADAWFLDGFSPACNQDMWRPAVFDALAHRSAPGARCATFTVAGDVRRGLAAAGFEVAKAPGYGRKRERLEARLASPAPLNAAQPRIAIVGAGIAGAALARAFRALGAPAEVLEAVHPGAGASGNPAALVMPRLDAGGGTVAQLYAQAVARAHDLYGRHPDAVIARGVLQLEIGPKDPSRFDRIAASELFAAGAIERLSRAAMGERLGEDAPAGGLALAEALVIRPSAILKAWLGETRPRTAAVARIAREDGAWWLYDAGGGVIARADVVCLAAGLACRDLAPEAPLSAVRGQVGFFAAKDRPDAVIGAGYLIPTPDGLLFGATHDRDDIASDVRAGDMARNLDLLRQLRPSLATAAEAAPLDARAGVRAVTPDFLPLAGALGQPGLYILCGLGSRGFCAAPLLAEHLAATAIGAASPLPRNLAAIVEPSRFDIRRRQRGGGPPRPRPRADDHLTGPPKS
jgi:tRNA 5-methylaminomethyl-2-thiouridine biosynthesis bifunctional protein